MRRIVVEKILLEHLADNVQARRLNPDGSYERLRPKGDTDRVDSQMVMVESREQWTTA